MGDTKIQGTRYETQSVHSNDLRPSSTSPVEASPLEALSETLGDESSSPGPRSGNQSGTLNDQSGTIPDQSVILSGESGTVPAQSGAVAAQSGTPSNLLDTLKSRTEIISRDCEIQLHSVNPTTDFDIASPVRPRGRPKQKPKAKKDKKSIAIEMTRDDSDMHERRLSLNSIKEALSGEATYESAGQLLNQFKQSVFDRRPKPPIAHSASQLPPGKPITNVCEFTRVFAWDLLRKCDAKVTAY
ncbi:hypothetical protein GN244_ATG09118 [Phytophthora infestans]|uniref:Uncharacterized protein n=1 Tax=Phytophthora infestans TaxID=4787 RepID=A0A833WE53_PHYIN|nr:hypothetical protein GN244_ATG09118 [Phytophthora infestans]